MSGIDVKLGSDWDRFVKEIEKLGDKAKRQEILKVLRRAAKPTLMAAQNNVPVKEGKLKKSMGLITGKSKEYPNILVGPRVKRGFAGRHGHLIEFGTAPRKKANGAFTGSMPAQPYMRPAFEQTKGIAVALSTDLVARYLQKVINKVIK